MAAAETRPQNASFEPYWTYLAQNFIDLPFFLKKNGKFTKVYDHFSIPNVYS